MGNQAETESRLEALKKKGVRAPMPPNPMPHLYRRLVEIGLSEPAGMGVSAISWRTLAAWQRLTGVELSPWEARVLRKMSQAYVAEGHKAEAETCPPPWRAPVTQREREIEETALRGVLG